MKRTNKILILLGVLVVFCIATFAVIRHEERKEKIKNSDQVILEIPVDSVQSLSWEKDKETLSFHKRDGKWVYDGDEAFPVDEEKMRELLGVFEQFGVSFIIEEVEDYGQYGLDKPVCTIKLSTGDKSYEIRVGGFSTMDQQRYVSIGDGNAYLVKNDPMDLYGADLSDVIDNDDPPKYDKVTRIQFKGEASYSIVHEEGNAYAYGEDDVYYAQMNGSNLPVDARRVNSYLSNIGSLNLTNYLNYKVTDEDLKKYGLDNPELTVTVDYTAKDEAGKETSDTFVLSISRDPEEKRKAAEKAEKEKDDESKDNDNPEEEEEITAYARVGESPIVYQISADAYKNLMAASYDDMRHLEVLPASFEEITKIDISLEGFSYVFSSEKKDDKRTYYYQDKELDLTGFREALEKLKAERFTDEQPSKKEEIGLTFYLDHKNYKEVHVKLYRYDGTYCLAVIDGKPAALVKRSNAIDLVEAVYAIILG